MPKTDPPETQEEYITVAGQRFEDQPHSAEPKLLPADELHPPRSRRRGRRLEDEGLDDLDDGLEGYSAEEEAGGGVEMTERRRQSLVSQAHEDDQVAESNPAAGALGPALGAALANASSPPTASLEPSTPSASSANGLSPTDEQDRGRHDSGGSVTLAPSSSPTTLTFPPKAHLANGTEGVNGAVSTAPHPRTSESSAAPSYLHFAEPPEDWEPPKRLAVERVPNSAPVLTEQYRYDPREGIVRPYRSHRCRHCAAVVLST